MRGTVAAVLLATLVLAGCGEYELGKPRGRSAAPEAVGVVVDPMAPAPPASARKSEAPEPDKPTTETPGPPAPRARQEARAAEGRPQMGAMPPAEESGQLVVREKAEVGMGKKGHYSPGFITTPLSTFWRTKEMVAYRIQVPQALKLYRGCMGTTRRPRRSLSNRSSSPTGSRCPNYRRIIGTCTIRRKGSCSSNVPGSEEEREQRWFMGERVCAGRLMRPEGAVGKERGFPERLRFQGCRACGNSAAGRDHADHQVDSP